MSLHAEACKKAQQKLISRWDSRTLPPEPCHRCKTLPHLISPYRSPISLANPNFFGASWLFWLLRLINGAAKTLSRVQQEFYWPGVHECVTRYVASCDLWRRRHLRKTADQRNRSHLREMNFASFSIQISLARIARLEPSLDWTVI